MKNIRIRKMKPEDAVSVTRIHRNTIRAVNAKDYSEADIRAWSGRITATWLKNPVNFKKEMRYVGTYRSNIVGFINLEKNHRDEDVLTVAALYVRQGFIGRGIGRQLIEHAERIAKRKGFRFLQLHGTMTAQPFYQKCGFKKIRKAYSVVGRRHIMGYVMKKRVRETS